MMNGAAGYKTQALRWVGGKRWPRHTKAAMGVGVVVLWGALGCHRTTAHAQDSAFSYQGAQDTNQPDYSNLAPVDGQYSGQNEAQQQAYRYQQGGAPPQSAYQEGGYPQGAPIERNYPGADPNGYPQNGDPNTYYDDQSATDQAQAVYEADLTDEEAYEPPPALPDYEQPPPPDEDYIWTPGYWAWAPEGYYWVPGVWVEPPYVGALWTPGYWAFYGGRYRFHHGFWGLHIGFYGGINYGYGYTGYGYYGGYWRSGHFFYNRQFNRISDTRRFRVYDYHVNVGSFAGRPSFNGPRGIMVRPRPAEVAVMRERRYAPLPAQQQLRQQMMQNRQQFYGQNHGRPVVAVESRPVVSNHQMPAALPQPAWRGGGNTRGQGYRTGRDSNRGGWQGVQPNQPGQQPNQVQPSPQGRVMPQQGRQTYNPQTQGQPGTQAPATPQTQLGNRQGWEGRQNSQGRGNVQVQPTTPAQPQGQPQKQAPAGLEAWRAQHNIGQPQSQPQPQQDYRRGGWQGREAARPQAPAPTEPQPQAQPQPQQDYRRGGWQGREAARPQAPAPTQPQPQAQPQPQFRRGPEGVRSSPPPPQAQPQPQGQPHPQAQPQGQPRGGRDFGRGRDR